MKRSVSILAAAVALTLSAQVTFAADVQVRVPSTPDAVRAADLIARAQRALIAYVSSCSARDHVGVESAVTTDAVFEYALDDSPNYLSVAADSLIGDCWSTVPALDTGERIQTLWIFPTGEANTVFVHYSTSAPGESAARSTEHLAFVEMRGSRIARLHDFTSVPPAMVASAKPKSSERSAARVSSVRSGS
jgi:hypothetical protein